MPTSGKGAMPLPPTPSSHNHVNPGVPVFSSGLQAPAGKVQGSPGKAQRVGVAANQGHSCSHVQHVSSFMMAMLPIHGMFIVCSSLDGLFNKV